MGREDVLILILFCLPSHSGGGEGRGSGFDYRGITIHVLCELERHQRRLAIDGRVAGRDVHDTAHFEKKKKQKHKQTNNHKSVSF